MRKYPRDVSVSDLLKGEIVAHNNQKTTGSRFEKLQCRMTRFPDVWVDVPIANLAVVSVLIFLIAGLLGCGESPAPKTDDFIIKAGTIRILSAEFADELDLKLTAYPYDLKSRPEEYNSMVLDLVSTLSDETILMAAANEQGISIAPEELKLAETEFKKDYPDDSFDQMLLENAISYAVWIKQLKKDMVINKLVRQELINAQQITPEDMVAFYNQYQKQTGNSSAADAADDLDETTLVEQLRMEKSQASYADWIAGLKARYPVDINKKAVAGFFMNRE